MNTIFERMNGVGLVAGALLLLLGLGAWERRRHQKNIDSISLRININGIRGKSTVTRLITGIMMEAGLKTIGKTTGTQARMIYWNREQEEPIVRRPEGPNIREQKVVVAKAAKEKAECLVSECMAVNPDYQIIFQNDMLQANIGVIVNVLEDHMDVMGPTLNEVAEAFTATIPYRGYVIVNESPFVPYYEEIARKRRTKLIVCDTSRISEEYLRRFEYMIFPENAALALAVAEAAGIDEEIALRGMLNAPPDPGAMVVLPMGDPSDPAYFVNGFAANDASSTLNIWKRVKELGYPTEDPIIIMNCREDRVDRTEQFAKDVLPYIPAGILVLIGETTGPIADAYHAGNLPATELYDLEKESISSILQCLAPVVDGRVIYGVGNIHGSAEPLIERFQKYKIEKELWVS
ncbi:poly-gamma-glutamate synthase PgsB [Mechercharimyces sp. CAU 1602]|uniref:poly-gamma-glutamate synthase PgsB n=1 Tax=Mechercharimyces sp. CAU 1602 TaxID=2973933 RepID=UPI002162477D|nr:poly-gamma-glutamate synthase PgsB [Mechercharimyces sp. CAU 1602]MCS1350217.1 poly-gamma-glutamate synthase PgsB [Mechercharimyces sp. CAU 1602]